MLVRIAEIVYYMQKRQYQRANDSYLRLSIGNAPWPIGVTMVGCVFIFRRYHHLIPIKRFASIHERSAREKISTDQVAHVLNDEVSRKYIQSLKRSVSSFCIFLFYPCFIPSVDPADSFFQALDVLSDKIPTGGCFTAYGIVEFILLE